MPQTGHCTDVTCGKELTELYECHCCGWLICLKHLLEHVEISKRDKEAQLDTLTNDLMSKTNTLELIVEKKVQEIEREKQFINHAKTITRQATRTIEELQLISEEINQAIVSNRKETVVKVEPSLFDMRTCSCTNQVANGTNTHRTEALNLYQETPSPTRRSLRRRTNELEKSTTSKNNDDSLKVNIGSDVISINDESMDSAKDETDDDEQDQENINNYEIHYNQCPLTFDGAFGLTKANHAIECCPVGSTFPQNFIGHLTYKHKLKKVHARRLYEAMKRDLDPSTTKLFRENEDVINHKRYVPCPFSKSMINLTECHASSSRNIPCSYNLITHIHLIRHLTKYHDFPLYVAQKIKRKHLQKLFNRTVKQK